MSRLLRALATSMVSVVVLTSLMVLPAVPAAASGWPVTVGSTSTDRPSTLMTHPSGRVYVCDYDSAGERGMLGLESDGSQFLDAPYRPHRPDLCLNEWYDGNVATIDADGVTYGVKTSAYDGDFVIAYDGATELWEAQLSSPCGGTNVYDTAGPMLAPDGTLFIIHDQYCSGRRAYLTRIDSATGTTIDTRELWRGLVDSDALRQYDGGFVFRPTYSSEFFFYQFEDLDNPSVYEPTLEPGEASSRTWDVDPATGTLYLTTDAEQACHEYETISSVISYDGQSQTRHDLEAACLSWSSPLTVSPNGAVVVGTEPTYSPGLSGEGESKVVFIDDNGVTIETLPDPSAHRLRSLNEMRVDARGNVLIAREYDIRPSSRDYRHVDFLFYDAGGTLLKRFSTESLERESWYHYQDVVLAEGEIYALVRRGKSAGDYEVHQFPMALAGFDYSKGTLLGVTSTPVEPLRYVAMGDSFSSGEGVEPFLDGTTESPEQCHRSELAYSRLLAADPSSPWVMADDDFVACSGAVMSNITTSGQHGAPAQIDALDEDVDVVTVTIGGNDVGFGDTVSTCVKQSEEDCQEARDGLKSRLTATHTSELVSTLEDIEEATGGNAQVFVGGYPSIFPVAYAGEVGECRWGPFLPYIVSGRQVTQSELTDMHTMTLLLNGLTRDAVDEMGGNFHFVDPSGEFAEHELCTDDPWFHGVVASLDPSVQNYSFHPTVDGQSAYSQAFRSDMT